MHEIFVERLQVVAARQHVEQLLAHAHERGGAAWREIKPAEKLLPPRLGGSVHLSGRLIGRLLAPSGDRALHAYGIGAEALRQRFKEGDARAGAQFGIAAEDFAGERDAGGFAAAGEQVLA
jgi:hypothetical protein